MTGVNMGCGSAGSRNYSCVRGTKTLLFFRVEKFLSAAPINGNKQCRQIDGNFDCHGNAAVRRGAHRLMEHIRGFTRSHWMPPSV